MALIKYGGYSRCNVCDSAYSEAATYCPMCLKKEDGVKEERERIIRLIRKTAKRYEAYAPARGEEILEKLAANIETTEERFAEAAAIMVSSPTWSETKDTEITCMFCGVDHCDVETRHRRGGRTLWSGAHKECIPKLNEKQ